MGHPLQKSLLNNTRIDRFNKLITNEELRLLLPQSDHAALVTLTARQDFINILQGCDNRLCLITGPCSIHDSKAAIEYAEKLSKILPKYSDKILIIMRVYFEKPRTSTGWKGLITDPQMNGSNEIGSGLKIARKIMLDIAEMGVSAAAELLDPIFAAYIGELISWGAIGARTTESQTHRQMASGISAPIGFKNATDGSLDVAINALKSAAQPHSFIGVDDDGTAGSVHTTGNPNTHIILRGANAPTKYIPNYHIEEIEYASLALKKAGFLDRIMVDCSHANSLYNHTNQFRVVKNIISQKKEGNTSIFGLMLESNLKEGNQKMGSNLSHLEYGVSVTDACVSWEQTEEIINYIYENI